MLLYEKIVCYWRISCEKWQSSWQLFSKQFSVSSSKLSDLNVARFDASCTVLEGKIVVTGGVSNYFSLKSVEAYDYYEDKWTCLPDIIEERCDHAAVSIGYKMFVIGGQLTTSCEVFNSFYKKTHITRVRL